MVSVIDCHEGIPGSIPGAGNAFFRKNSMKLPSLNAAIWRANPTRAIPHDRRTFVFVGPARRATAESLDHSICLLWDC